MITQADVRAWLTYDPETGLFRRNGQPRTSVHKSTGYIRVCVHSTLYLAHHLAFLYMTGVIPTQVDHKNRIRSDNRWSNLRASNFILNGQNRTVKITSTSGFLGVSKARNKWRADIKANGAPMYLGIRDTIEEANALYLEAKQQYHIKS